jgi:hypothetical protein
MKVLGFYLANSTAKIFLLAVIPCFSALNANAVFLFKMLLSAFN